MKASHGRLRRIERKRLQAEIRRVSKVLQGGALWKVDRGIHFYWLRQLEALQSLHQTLYGTEYELA